MNTCWEPWQVPVIQLLGGRFWWMAWRWDTCCALVHVDLASALRLPSTWPSPRSWRGSGCSKAGRIGSGGKPSSQKLPWGSVVGQRQWVASSQQPTQYSQTQNFCLFQWRQGYIPYDNFELTVEQSLISQMCLKDIIYRWISCLKYYLLSSAGKKDHFGVAKKHHWCKNILFSVPVKQAAIRWPKQGIQHI